MPLPRWLRLLAANYHLVLYAAVSVLAYFFLNWSIFAHHARRLLMRDHDVFGAGVFIACYAVAALALTVFLATAHRVLVAAVAILLVLIVTTNFAVTSILDIRVINFSTGGWLLEELGQVGNALSEFGFSVLSAGGTALLVITPLIVCAGLLRTSLRPMLSRGWRTALSTVALLSYFSAAWAIDELFANQAPRDGNLAVYTVRTLIQGDPDLLPPSLARVSEPLATKVVLIVDESVRFREFRKVLLPEFEALGAVDLGEAASLGNCSASSNALLRWGLSPTRLASGEDPRRSTTIWGYAHAAGLRTILIDGQRRGINHNFMRKKERLLIDELVAVSEGKETDRAIARELNRMLRDAVPRFIYVNKRGVHFPYGKNLPDEMLERMTSRQELYEAALRYSTSGFITRVLEGVDRSSLFVLYTSDHGQSYGDGVPHCSAHPDWGEYSVPLVAITGSASLQAKLAQAWRVNRDHLSHAHVFATLVTVMGFDGAQAAHRYYPAIWHPMRRREYYVVPGSPLPDEDSGDAVIRFATFPYRSPES